jgi:hypothetical protein
MQNSKLKIQSWVALFCIVHFALLIGACSIPSLESAECSQARDTVKQFYSWYLGTDLDTRLKQPEILNRFVAKKFQDEHPTSDPAAYFFSDDLPKTFKIGACKQIDPQKVDMQVQIYWRDDKKTVQKEVHVETVKTGDAWLINNVSN